MAGINDLITDPDFNKLSPEGQKKALSQFDPEIGSLSDAAYQKFLTGLKPESSYGDKHNWGTFGKDVLGGIGDAVTGIPQGLLNTATNPIGTLLDTESLRISPQEQERWKKSSEELKKNPPGAFGSAGLKGLYKLFGELGPETGQALGNVGTAVAGGELGQVLPNLKGAASGLSQGLKNSAITAPMGAGAGFALSHLAKLLGLDIHPQTGAMVGGALASAPEIASKVAEGWRGVKNPLPWEPASPNPNVARKLGMQSGPSPVPTSPAGTPPNAAGVNRIKQFLQEAAPEAPNKGFEINPGVKARIKGTPTEKSNAPSKTSPDTKGVERLKKLLKIDESVPEPWDPKKYRRQ